jgi:hypothetical protein
MYILIITDVQIKSSIFVHHKLYHIVRPVFDDVHDNGIPAFIDHVQRTWIVLQKIDDEEVILFTDTFEDKFCIIVSIHGQHHRCHGHIN